MTTPLSQGFVHKWIWLVIETTLVTLFGPQPDNDVTHSCVFPVMNLVSKHYTTPQCIT